MIRILGAHGITQGQICAMTGIAQSTLSNYKRGKNQAEWASTFEKLADGLGMPLPLRQALGLSGDASPNGSRPAAGMVAGVPADTFDLQLLAEAIGRNGTTREAPRHARAGRATQRHRSSRAKRSMGTPRLRSH